MLSVENLIFLDAIASCPNGIPVKALYETFGESVTEQRLEVLSSLKLIEPSERCCLSDGFISALLHPVAYRATVAGMDEVSAWKRSKQNAAYQQSRAQKENRSNRLSERFFQSFLAFLSFLFDQLKR